MENGLLIPVVPVEEVGQLDAVAFGDGRRVLAAGDDVGFGRIG